MQEEMFTSFYTVSATQAKRTDRVIKMMSKFVFSQMTKT